MRFEPTTFFVYQEVGKDELGNPRYDDAELGVYDAKLTQWTTEEIALLDRKVTQNERKLLTKAPIDVLQQATSFLIGDVTYTITEVKSDFTRWRLAHVKEYKK